MTDVQEKKDAQDEFFVNDDQIEAARNHLYNGFLGEYKRFINILVSSPIAIEAMVDGLKFLDTGMLWIKEAAYHGPIVNKHKNAKAPEKPSESSNEKIEEIVSAA